MTDYRMIVDNYKKNELKSKLTQLYVTVYTFLLSLVFEDPLS